MKPKWAISEMLKQTSGQLLTNDPDRKLDVAMMSASVRLTIFQPGMFLISLKSKYVTKEITMNVMETMHAHTDSHPGKISLISVSSMGEKLMVPFLKWSSNLHMRIYV